MRKIEGNCDGRDAGGGKPFIAEIAIWKKCDTSCREFGAQLTNMSFQFAAFDSEPQIAEPDGEEFVVFQAYP